MFYYQRVVDGWNGLPAEIAEAKSLNVFKTKLDDYFKDNNIY